MLKTLGKPMPLLMAAIIIACMIQIKSVNADHIVVLCPSSTSPQAIIKNSYPITVKVVSSDMAILQNLKINILSSNNNTVEKLASADRSNPNGAFNVTTFWNVDPEKYQPGIYYIEFEKNQIYRNDGKWVPIQGKEYIGVVVKNEEDSDPANNVWCPPGSAFGE
ncbi:152_t:CDS:2 [Paraglomus occultum]|uniref:152_t:CDS:1 n=1 Tax=Paraglomus occultum TaxID=144539 RepID=A0A9N9C6U6_9GLOM|nr:152_t:CDS:2 [Paraglomus occultum]